MPTRSLNVVIAADAKPLGKATKQGEKHLDDLDKAGVKAGASLRTSIGGAGPRIGGSLRTGLAGLPAVTALAGAAAGAALVKGLSGAMDVEEANTKLKVQLGLSEKESARIGKVAGKLYASNYGDSMGEVNTALKSVITDVDGLGKVSGARLKGITGDVISVSKAFDQDLGGVTRAVGQMMRTGLAKDAQEALNIVTKGFQAGADKSGDFLDTLNEYGTQFRKLGIDGETATGLISQGLQAGARDSDIVADAIKEFSIRAIDGSQTTSEGFKAIGLDAEKMAEKIGKGGKPAAKGLDEVLDRLRAIKDPVEQSKAAVALFGTQAEDLGDALFALDPSKAVKGLGNVAGAARKVSDEMGGTPKSKIQEFWRTLQAGGTNALAKVTPALGNAASAATGFVKEMSDGTGAGGKFADIVTGAFDRVKGVISGAVGTVKGIVSAFREGQTWALALAGGLAGLAVGVAVIKTISAVTKIWAGAQVLLNLAMTANPIGLIVVGLVALGAGLVVAYKKSETFRNIVNGAFNAIKENVGPAFEIVKKVVGRAVDVVKGYVSGMAKVVQGVVAVVKGVLTGDFSKAWDGVKKIVRGALDALGAVIRGVWKPLGEAMISLGKLMIRKLGEGLKALPGKALEVGEVIGKGILSGLGDLGHLLLEKAKAALSFVGDNLPGPAGALGKIIKAATGDGIGQTMGTPTLPSGGAFGGSLQGASSVMKPFAAMGSGYGLSIAPGGGKRPGGTRTSSGGISWHGSGRAIDESGSPSGMMAYFKALKSRFGSILSELIYTPGGIGIKNGRPFKYTGKVAADHFDHVHVAYGGPGLPTGDGPGTGDGLGSFNSTAYGPPWNAMNGTGVTANGTNLKPAKHAYGVAVDPSVIPLGTKLKINPNPFGYSGTFTAFDTGGAIKGKRIDFYDWRGRASQMGWGRKSVTVSTVGGGSTSHGGKGTTTFKPASGTGAYTGSNTASGVGSLSGGVGQDATGETFGGNPYAGMLEGLGLAKAEAGTDAKKLLPLLMKELKLKLKRLEKVKKALTRRLTKATRSRLTLEATQLVGELSDIWEAAVAVGAKGAPPKGVVEKPRDPGDAGGSDAGGSDADVDAGPTQGDFLTANVARARLTEGLEDDIAASTAYRDYLQGQMNTALADSDPRNDAEAIDAYLQAVDAVKALTGALENSDLNAAVTALTAEIKRQTDTADKVRSTSEYQLTKTLADLVSGHIVGYGVAGRAFTPGTGTEYSY